MNLAALRRPRAVALAAAAMALAGTTAVAVISASGGSNGRAASTGERPRTARPAPSADVRPSPSSATSSATAAAGRTASPVATGRRPAPRGVVAPVPGREQQSAPEACTAEQRQRYLPPPDDGGVVELRRAPGAAYTIGRRGSWLLVLRVRNPRDIPLTFTERSRSAAVFGGTAFGGVVGGVRRETPDTTRTVPPGGHVDLEIEVPALHCDTSDALPYSSYTILAGVVTDEGTWQAEKLGWVVDAPTAGCFALPALSRTPPLPGLTATGDTSAPVVDKVPRPQYPDVHTESELLVRNASSRPATLVTYGRAVVYLVREGEVVGGWPLAAPGPATAVRHEIPARGHITIGPVAGESTGCRTWQPQALGPVDVIVALPVERDGVRYHWAVAAGRVTFVDPPDDLPE